MDGDNRITIARITAEQLDYLISRIVGTTDAKDRKRWRGRVYSLTVALAVQVTPLFTRDKTRTGFFITTSAGTASIGPTGTTGPNIGINVAPSTTNPTFISRDEVGWQITEPWEVATSSAGTIISGVEVTGGYNWIDAL